MGLGWGYVCIGGYVCNNLVELSVEKKEGAARGTSSFAPSVHLSVVKSRVYKEMSYFKYFAFQLRELNLDLDETFIMRYPDS